MDSVRNVLAGWQESILPEIERYWIENPDITQRRSTTKLEPFQVSDRVAPGKAGRGRQKHGNVTPEHGNVSAIQTDDYPRSQRRPRAKIQSGWIEERKANPKRRNPTTCYYFCWYEIKDDTRRKMKIYVPQNQMSTVWKACKIEKRPYFETLQLIQKSHKAHHTDTPKP